MAEACNHVNTVSSTETLLANNQGTRRHMPEGRDLHKRAARVHLTRIAASLLEAATQLTLVQVLGVSKTLVHRVALRPSDEGQ